MVQLNGVTIDGACLVPHLFVGHSLLPFCFCFVHKSDRRCDIKTKPDWARIGVAQVRPLDDDEKDATHWRHFNLREVEAIEVEEAVNMFSQGMTEEWPRFNVNGTVVNLRDENASSTPIADAVRQLEEADDKPAPPPTLRPAQVEDWSRGVAPSHAPTGGCNPSSLRVLSPPSRHFGADEYRTHKHVTGEHAYFVQENGAFSC